MFKRRGKGVERRAAGLGTVRPILHRDLTCYAWRPELLWGAGACREFGRGGYRWGLGVRCTTRSRRLVDEPPLCRLVCTPAAHPFGPALIAFLLSYRMGFTTVKMLSCPGSFDILTRWSP